MIYKVIRKMKINSLLMNVMNKYALWIMPEGEAFSVLQQTIRDLSEMYVSRTRFITAFEPDVRRISKPY
ncbi:MAG: hypothetical protein AB1390_08275 [Nitrospirota bacterium]